MKRMLTLLFLLLLAASLVGCASYYKVTDPGSGKVYYTDDIEEDDGTVQFKDANSRSQVTLQQSEVLEISEDEYEAATRK